jgi:signal transduction histidine kinase/CheY-like chemotaxis protein/HPt (histidine-containing phosphotransfer) domain-containing protein
MNNRSTDNHFFHMAVGIVLISTIVLVVVHLPEYTRNGTVFILIPIALCAVLLAAGIPLMGYLKKIWLGASESGYFQAANLFAIFSTMSFILIRLPGYILFARYFNIAVLLVFCFLVIGGMIVLMVRIKTAAPLAFYIPALAFTFYTLGTLFLGGTAYYFLIYLVICGFGSGYNHYNGYRNFAILSHLTILCLVLLDLPFLGPGISRNDIILNWIIAAYVTVFFLMLSRFSSEKSDRSSRAQDTFATLMAATPNLIAMVDGSNKVTYISKPLAELTHIEDHEMASGRPVIDLFPDIDMKLVIGEILESDGFYDGAVELIHHGKKRYFRIISDILPGAGRGRFIDMSDITPLMEARLEAEEAKARAEEANSAKSAFLARMSHEIRTPMNAITGMSELILREEASPAVHEHATAVKQAGGNLVSIINDILDFSKIESGKMEIVPMEYDFASLINDVIAIIRIRLREKPICFVANLDDSIPKKLYGDVVRVRQILLNLLSNAVKYTNQGHIILSALGKEGEGGEIALVFEIADTGIGIKEEDRDKLFSDFTRVDAQANRNVEGAGLGLAIARSLCRAMGGDITLRSVYGEGSVFTALIPQGIRSRAPFAEVEEPETKRVLVCDSRELYAGSIIRSLKSLGVSCKLASAPEVLVQALGEEFFDFIFAAPAFLDQAQGELRKRGIENTILVLLADYGEVVSERQARFIAMPAHAGSIANILNRCDEPYHEDARIGLRFTAPSARVLIVDDIKTNLDVAEGLLAPYGMEIDACQSGDEAIRLVRENRYDLVLLDHMMPEKNGVDTAGEIRALEGEYFQRLPLVMLTANAIAGMRDMFLAMGLNDYISKPIDILKLDEVLARWIPAKKQIKNGGGIPRKRTRDKTGLLIPGVDIQKGIAMTGGTEEGYRKVLAQFSKDLRERLPVFAEFPAEKDPLLLAAQAHAVKGASASIGAAEVSVTAARLEAAGKAGDAETLRELLPEFHRQLSDLAAGIDHALGEDRKAGRRAFPDSAGAERGGPTPKPGGPNLGDGKTAARPEALKLGLESLGDALLSKNMREIDRLIEEMEELAENPRTREVLEAISDQVLLGEFQEAHQSLSAHLDLLGP